MERSLKYRQGAPAAAYAVSVRLPNVCPNTAPQTWWAYAIGFLLFRAADIVKPWPASWCDREVHGGLGVMLDDLVAGLYSGVALWLIARYLPSEGLIAQLGL